MQNVKNRYNLSANNCEMADHWEPCRSVPGWVWTSSRCVACIQSHHHWMLWKSFGSGVSNAHWAIWEEVSCSNGTCEVIEGERTKISAHQVQHHMENPCDCSSLHSLIVWVLFCNSLVNKLVSQLTSQWQRWLPDTVVGRSMWTMGSNFSGL